MNYQHISINPALTTSGTMSIHDRIVCINYIDSLKEFSEQLFNDLKEIAFDGSYIYCNSIDGTLKKITY